MAGNSPAHYEVAVVGAGQAGLAIGHFLALQGRKFVILEASDSVERPGATGGTRSSYSLRAATTAFPD
jgi:cation diffusion facilitator CzcD-associated flavoprotein CzcO